MATDDAWFAYWFMMLLVGTCTLLLITVAVGMLFLDWRDRRVIRGRHRGMGQISPRHQDRASQDVRTALDARAVHRRGRRRFSRSKPGAGAAGRRPSSA